MTLDYQFYKENFGNQYLKEKPGTARAFPVKIAGLDVDKSLSLKVVQIWNHMFEHDVDISAVIIGEQFLCKGKLKDYNHFLKKIESNEYKLGLDEKANFYLMFEADLIE